MDEYIGNMNVSYTGSQQEVLKLPQLPKKQQYLIEDFDRRAATTLSQAIQSNSTEDFCDCSKRRSLLKDCPHLKKEDFLNYYQKELPYRLTHIDVVNSENKIELKHEIMHMVLHNLRVDCRYEETQLLKQHQTMCHIHRDLERLFGESYLATLRPPVINKYLKEPMFGIYSSLLLNIILLVLKFICLMSSSSVFVMFSFIDNTLSMVSGIILIIALRKAHKGIQSGGFQKALHKAHVTQQFIYATRFELLGVIAFAAMMGIAVLHLAMNAILSIIEQARGHGDDLVLTPFIQAVFGVAVCLKISLYVWLRVAHKRAVSQKELLKACVDDNRNDVLTHAAGLSAICLAYYVKGVFLYADAVVSVCLCIFIFVCWAETGLISAKSMAGAHANERKQTALLMQLLHCFELSHKIRSIEQFVVYQSGNSVIVEVEIGVDRDLDVKSTHDIVMCIQEGYERTEGVERAYVKTVGK